MDELDKEEDIRQFIVTNGLDKDEGSDLEVYRQRGELIAEFFRNIESRLVFIENRLSRLGGEWCGHEKK